MKIKIIGLYKNLLKKYGFQGWWPLLDCKGHNPTKTGSIKGYHPKDYSYPYTEDQKFEICVGAILKQLCLNGYYIPVSETYYQYAIIPISN